LIGVKHAVIAARWQSPTLCAALDECATSLLARYPVIAEKQHGSEKAYFNKVVSSHSRTPARIISEPLFKHGGLAIMGRKTSKIEQRERPDNDQT
jgi:hypothetical protein